MFQTQRRWLGAFFFLYKPSCVFLLGEGVLLFQAELPYLVFRSAVCPFFINRSPDTVVPYFTPSPELLHIHLLAPSQLRAPPDHVSELYISGARA